jgi:hypothetical protein
MPTYRPYHLRESLFAWAPQSGSRAALDNKFHVSDRLDVPPDAAARDGTAYFSSTNNVAPGDYEVPTRKLGLQVLVMHKPTVGGSVMSGALVDAPALVRRARSVPAAALEAAVAALDARGDGFLLLREVRDALSRAYAAASLGEPEEPLVATLVALFSREGRTLRDGSTVVPNELFARGLAAAADMWDEDLALGRPEVLAKSGSLREKAAAARVVGPAPPRKLAAPPPPRLTGPPPSPMRATRPAGAFAATVRDAERGAADSGADAGEGDGSGAAANDDAAPTVDVLALTATPASERSAPLGDGLLVTRDGTLALSPRASRGARELTGAAAVAAATAAAAASSRSLGLKTGALREAALAGERALAGTARAAAPSPSDFKLGGPAYVTSNMRDFGDFNSDPRARPIAEPGVAGFPISARELAAGTTRVSQHPPGYTGTLPLYGMGPMAEQGLGAHKRDTFMMKTNMCGAAAWGAAHAQKTHPPSPSYRLQRRQFRAANGWLQWLHAARPKVQLRRRRQAQRCGGDERARPLLRLRGGHVGERPRRQAREHAG